jgi:hypothetical protein
MSYLFTPNSEDGPRRRAECEQFKARIEKACHTNFDGTDCEAFVDIIRNVSMNHERRLSAEVPDHQPNLHKLAPHLAAAIELLERRANSSQLRAIFDGKFDPSASPKVFVVRPKRHSALLRDLRLIQRALPNPPEEPGPGRPSATPLLYALAKDVADVWVQLTGKKFSSVWAGKGKDTWKPKNPAAKFVYAIVDYIDNHNIGSLRKVMQAIVKSDRATARNGN